MNTRNSKLHRFLQDEKVNRYFEILFFVSFSFIYLYRVILTTFFDTERISLLIKAGIAGTLITAGWQCAKHICKKFSTVMIPVLLLPIPVLYWRVRGDGYFLVLALLILGAWGISFRKILILSLLMHLSVLAETSYAATHGIIYNLTRDVDFFYSGGKYSKVYLYGTIHNTDLAAHYFWMMAIYLWIRGLKVSWKEILLWAMFIPFLYSKTGANTTFIGQCLLLIGAIGCKLLHQHPGDGSSKVSKTVALAAVSVFCIAAVIMIYLSVNYNAEIPFYKKTDQLVHWRLSLGHQGFVQHPVRLIAEEFQMVGASRLPDGSLPGPYNFIDSSYIAVLLCYGAGLFIWMLCIMTWNQIRQKNSGYRYGMYLFCIIAIICMEEQHMQELEYNVFLLMPLSKLRDTD